MGDDVRGLLEGLALFRGLGADALATVADHTIVKTVRRGAFLFRRGEPCQGLYVVIEGRIKVYRASPDGREQVLHLDGPGQPVAEVPLFDGGPYPASARAIEESRVLFLPRDAFQWLYQNNPDIADTVIRDLGRRLRRLVALVEKVSLKDVGARVAATLIEYAEAEDAARDGGTFRLPRTQEELAAELATTRESVARGLARLRREGAIAQQGARIRILSLVRLAAAARGEPGG